MITINKLIQPGAVDRNVYLHKIKLKYLKEIQETRIPHKITNDVLMVILIILGISDRTFENALIEVNEPKFI